MKKLWKILSCSVLCVTALCGCSGGDKSAKDATSISSQSIESVQSSEISDEVNYTVFYDAAFEKYLRNCLGKLSGDLTEDELGAIKKIGMDYNGYAMSISYNDATDGNNGIFESETQYVSREYDESKKLYIQSLEDLDKLPNLQSIVLDPIGGDIYFKNFDFIKYLPNLKFLTGWCSAPTLEPLKYCSSLEELNLYLKNHNITDFSCLENCKNLKKFHIEDYSGKLTIDLSQLKSFNNLEVICINGIKVDNEEILLELPNLKQVEIYSIDENSQVLNELRNKGVEVP